MVTGYRFTEDEFVFLAYFYQCMTVPAWFLCEPEQIAPEKALRTLERKGMLLKNGGKNTPHPVIEYLFSQLAQACAFFGGTDRIFCYFCPQLTLAAEQSGACACCRSRRRRTASPICAKAAMHARRFSRPPGRQTAAFRTKRKKRFGRSGRKGHEQRENSDRDQCRRCEPVV